MTTSLPLRPDLAQLKRQAKELLRAHHHGDTAACSSLRTLRQFDMATDAAILAADIKLHDVQFAIALGYGFSSWDALKHHIEQSVASAGDVTVQRQDGAVWIDGIPPLRWPESGRCTFIGALQRALNRRGVPVDYVDLMGWSGAAFRFCFAHPRWDWSSIDGMLGYNHGQAALAALGYQERWVSMEELRPAVMASIDRGRPVLGIDLNGVAEWGVIGGYANEGKVLLYHAYFENPDLIEYARTERTPWLNYFIDEQKASPPLPESILASLRIAHTIAFSDDFTSGGGCHYFRGFAGMETWITDLREDQRFAPEDLAGVRTHANINHFIYAALIDARDAGVRFLRRYADLLDGDTRGQLRQVADLYAQVVNVLREGTLHIPCPDNLDPHTWTPAIRAAQINTLRQVIDLERRAISIVDAMLTNT